MKIERKNNIWSSDESGLGFYCINSFECSQRNPSLNELLTHKILKEKELGSLAMGAVYLKEPIGYYGSILLNEIDASDFKMLTFEELTSEIEYYWEDKDWGEDLSIFKKNFQLTLSDLKDEKLSAYTFYYINAEKLAPQKLVEYNFYYYFVCVIATEPNSHKVITLTFGLD